MSAETIVQLQSTIAKQAQHIELLSATLDTVQDTHRKTTAEFTSQLHHLRQDVDAFKAFNQSLMDERSAKYKEVEERQQSEASAKKQHDARELKSREDADRAMKEEVERRTKIDERNRQLKVFDKSLPHANITIDGSSAFRSGKDEKWSTVRTLVPFTQEFNRAVIRIEIQSTSNQSRGILIGLLPKFSKEFTGRMDTSDIGDLGGWFLNINGWTSTNWTVQPSLTYSAALLSTAGTIVSLSVDFSTSTATIVITPSLHPSPSKETPTRRQETPQMETPKWIPTNNNSSPITSPARGEDLVIAAGSVEHVVTFKGSLKEMYSLYPAVSLFYPGQAVLLL